MSASSSFFGIWLADVHILTSLLLAAALGGLLTLRQPARRMAVEKATLAALAALAVLSALPGWSVWHLLAAEAPSSAPAPIMAAVDRAKFAPVADVQRLADVTLEEMSAPISYGAKPASGGGWEIAWPSALAAAHLVGSAAVVAWLVCGGVLARRVRRASVLPAPELLRTLQAVVGEGSAPLLLVSDAVATPVALGWFRPAIILPATLAGEPRAEAPGPRGGPAGNSLTSILAHEWAHIVHRDLLTLAASRWLLVLLWPQPLFWLLRRVIRLDQETLADAAAAERTGRLDYAEQLMGWARGGGPRGRAPRLAGAVGLWEGPSQLKRRIAALVDEKLTVLRTCSRRWRVGTTLSMIVAAGALSLVTLQPGAAPVALAQNAANDGAEYAQPAAEPRPAADGIGVTGGQLSIVPTPKPPAPIEVPAWARPEPNVVKGRVVDEARQALPGAEVTLFFADGRSESTKPTQLATVKTDENGEFRFENAVDVAKEFPEGLPDDRFPERPVKVVALLATSPGRSPSWGNTLASFAAGRGLVEQLALPPAQTLRGRVTDEAGRPIEGAEVRVGFVGPFPGTSINTGRTNAQGEYEVTDLAAYAAPEKTGQLSVQSAPESLGGTLTVTNDPVETPLLVLHPDFAMKRVAVSSIPGEQEVQLARGATIEGVAMLHDRDGAPQPAAGATIQITRELPPLKPGEMSDQFSYQTAQAPTDAEGRYRFSSLPAGKYTIYARAPGWTTQGLQGVAGEASRTTTAPELWLTRGGTVRLRLVDAVSGEPLALPDGTRGWVNPQLRPMRLMGIMPLDPNVMTFRKSLTEFPLAAGKYAFYVYVPGEKPQEGSWRSLLEAQSTEDGKSLIVHAVVEGETLEADVLMQKEAPQQATATISLVGPPVDGDAEADDQDAAGIPTDTFVPATLPADGQP